MTKTVVTLGASTIFNFEQGEHNAVRDGGDLYILVSSEKDIQGTTIASNTTANAPAETATTQRGVSASPNPPAQQFEEAQAQTAGADLNRQYTKDEMMDMETEDLMEIAKGLGINPSEHEGKNTNKKVRELILAHYAGGGSAPAETQSTGRGTRAQAEVADDTQQASSGGRARRSAPSNEPKLIDNWDNLQLGEKVLVKLVLDDPKESEKLWEAEIDGWEVPKGLTEERLYVKYLADGQTDYLRPGEDLVFEFQAQV